MIASLSFQHNATPKGSQIMKRVLLLAFSLICVQVSRGSAFAQDEMAAGEAAEQAGNLREAFTHYAKALQGVSDATSDDQRLREKIIALTPKLDPLPTIPEEAKRHSARGMAAIESAASKDDFDQAIKEFKEAGKLAPWWAKVYFNLGMTQEKATLYDDAVKSFKLYLAASPNDPGNDEIQQRIYKLEYLSEHKQQEVARAEAERRARDPQLLKGTWKNKESNRPYQVSITGNEFEADGGREPTNFLFRGILRGNQITGTLKVFGGQYVYQTDCTNPDSEMPMSGTVAEDRKSITFHYQVISFMTYGRHGLLYHHCDSVQRDHIEEGVLTLVR